MSHARSRASVYAAAMIYYLAHPVRPVDGETLEGNLAAALRWLHFFNLHGWEWHMDVIAPWLAELMVPVVDRDAYEAKQRTAAMARNLRVAGCCMGIVLCGPRLSTGMSEELAEFAGRMWRPAHTIINLVGIGTPDDLVARTDGTLRGIEAFLRQHGR